MEGMEKKIILKEKRPFLFHGEVIWHLPNTVFVVLEEKKMPIMGLSYKIKDLKFGFVLEGFHNSKDFEILGVGRNEKDNIRKWKCS
jgi:hypothetical protein